MQVKKDWQQNRSRWWFGLTMQREEPWRACLYCIRKPGENQIWKSNTSELVEWAATMNRETCDGRLLLRLECWQKVVFSRVENWCNVGSKNGETCEWITSRFFHSAHGQIYCWWRRSESDMSIKSRSFLHRANDRLRKMIDHLPEDAMQDIDKRSMISSMFMSSTLEAFVFMWKNHSEILHYIKLIVG